MKTKKTYPHSWSDVPTMMEIVPDFYFSVPLTAQRHSTSDHGGAIDPTVFPETYQDVDKDCMKISRRTTRPYKHRARASRFT